MELFGFELKRKEQKVESIVTPAIDDGATLVSSSLANYYGLTLDLEGTIKNENELIKRYRQVSQYSDCDSAIEDIVNEAIVSNDDSKLVTIVLDEVKLSESIKNKIRDEFDNIFKLYKFADKGHDDFRLWYIDGRAYYHIILDDKSPKNGILELRRVDPRKIRKIKKIHKDKNQKGVEIVKKVEEYYIYNDAGISETTSQGVKLSMDSVVYCPSGLIDNNTGMMLSYLHKAIKPVNQLKMIEDALVIYRISRAPERRIFYIDVGNLPKHKAEQYVNDIMNKFKNKIVYDAQTGEIKDNRQHQAMTEDFWMPRREGGKGTEITTLTGGQNLSNIEDIAYFQTKLYQSLNVPISRLQPQTGFSLGRSSEITRDEVKFNKFIKRLRKQYTSLFFDALKVQLVLKGIIRADEWDELKQDIRFNFQKDNYFSEMKENEVLNQRLDALVKIEPYVGKYYSINYVKKYVLMQTEDDIDEIEKEINDEAELMQQHAEVDGLQSQQPGE